MTVSVPYFAVLPYFAVPYLIICRTPSQLTFIKTEYHQNEITTLYEKLRELTTETKAMKPFVIEQILLVKNSMNDNNTQLQKKVKGKVSNRGNSSSNRHLRKKNNTKNCRVQTLMENQNNLLKQFKPNDRNHSEMFPTQHTQIVMLVKVLLLTQGTSPSLYKM